MREVLVAPTPDPALVAKLKVCGEIVHRHEDTKQDCAYPLEDLERRCGIKFGETYFPSVYAWASQQNFARLAAPGAPPQVQDITREKLIEIVNRVLSSLLPLQDYDLEFFSRSVADAGARGLIFWPGKPGGHEPTPEAIVDKAINTGDVVQL